MKPLAGLCLILLAAPLFADADLAVLPPLEPIRAHAGYDIQVNFPVRNIGPDSISAAIASIEFPEELQLVNTSLRGCGGTAPVRCFSEDLRVNSFYQIYLIFRAPARNATYDVSVALSHPLHDPDLTNNRATTTVTVSTLPDLSINLPIYPPPLDPGATYKYDVWAQNSANALFPARNVTLHLDFENATLESVDPRTWTCTSTETTLDCSVAEVNPISFVSFVLRASDARDGRSVKISGRLASDSEDFNPTNNEGAISIATYRWSTVTTTADAGEGSLRAAMDDANGHCSPGPCRIVFEIPEPVPDEGWFTIRPRSPLPVLQPDRVVVDGTRQTAFTGDTNPKGPEIFIDGRDVPGDGIAMRSSCDAQVKGLAIGNFGGYGVSMTRRSQSSCIQGFGRDRLLIEQNYIGVDPGMTAAPNSRGIFGAEYNLRITNNVISGNRRVGVWSAAGYETIDNNVITNNGGSGVFASPQSFGLYIVRNTISYNGEMGVAVSKQTNTTVHANSMRSNGGLGIDIGLDGVSPRNNGSSPNPPILFSATYDAASNTTTITGRIDYKRPQFLTDFTIGLYANDAPDGDGEEFLAAVDPPIGSDTFTATVKGDLRGKWINAALTRADWIYFNESTAPRAAWYEPSYKSTSELCEAIAVN